MSNCIPEVVDGAGSDALEEGIELGEGHFNGIEVGAVGRQEAQLGADLFVGLAHGGWFVGGQIVHDDDVTGLEGRDETLLHIGEKGRAVHGAVEDRGGCHALEPEGADEGGRLPVPVRDRGTAAGAAFRAAIAPRHLGRGAGLVDEDQPFGVEIGLSLEPGPPAARHVGPLLLAGVCRFFERDAADGGGAIGAVETMVDRTEL